MHLSHSQDYDLSKLARLARGDDDYIRLESLLKNKEYEVKRLYEITTKFGPAIAAELAEGHWTCLPSRISKQMLLNEEKDEFLGIINKKLRGIKYLGSRTHGIKSIILCELIYHTSQMQVEGSQNSLYSENDEYPVDGEDGDARDYVGGFGSIPKNTKRKDSAIPEAENKVRVNSFDINRRNRRISLMQPYN